jgi:hypothetical protein
LGLAQSHRESAVRGKQIKFQSESVTADLCLGVAIAGVSCVHRKLNPNVLMMKSAKMACEFMAPDR